MTIYELIKKGTIILKTNNIENANLKSRLIMQYVFKKDRQYILINDKLEPSKEKEKYFLQCIDMLVENIPLQHITNTQEFMKLNFFVNENVLIPRSDTEILVEEVINIINKIKNEKGNIGIDNISVMDLCTGSGAIAISLAKYIPSINITAVDISDKALEVAKKNAKLNNVEEKITFIKSDMFSKLEGLKFDVIVSNPPYIKKEVIKKLDKEVQKEPILALDGGIDGLDFYRLIVNNGYEYLKQNGYICLEIGYDQREDVIRLIENKKEIYSNTYAKNDLYSNDRIIITKLHI